MTPASSRRRKEYRFRSAAVFPVLGGWLRLPWLSTPPTVSSILRRRRAPGAVLRDAANSRPVPLDTVQAYVTSLIDSVDFGDASRILVLQNSGCVPEIKGPLQYMHSPATWNRCGDLCDMMVFKKGRYYVPLDYPHLGRNSPDTGDGRCCCRSGPRISWWRDLSSRTSRTRGARARVHRPSSGACIWAQSSCRSIRICAISAHDYCSSGHRILRAVYLAGADIV